MKEIATENNQVIFQPPVWLNNIGVVAVRDSLMGTWPARIKTISPHSADEKADMVYISRFGTKLSETQALGFFPDVKLPYKKN